VGERAGNTETELILVNLALHGVHQADLTLLPAYCQVVAQAYRIPLPQSTPLVGRRQHIEIGPLSGLANVTHWLRAHGRDPDDEALCHRILHAAKNKDHTLSKEELEAICRGA